MTDREQKFRQFKSLHEADKIFVMPNPWNAGTARILTAKGFPALATTSAGFAFSVGLEDSEALITRDEILANAGEIVEATDLPVSADLENGFGDDAEACAETIRLAMETGLVGGSIEDAGTDPDHPVYEISHAVERVAAAAEAAKDKPFLLTARAENHLYGRDNLDDTIRRLQAYEEAGADVLYAPGLPGLEAIRTVCDAVGKPVNVVMGLSGNRYSLDELQDAGVRRISVGGAFARAALGGLARAADEVLNQGTFNFAEDAVSHAEASSWMASSRAD